MSVKQPVRAAAWVFSLAFFPLGLGGVALGMTDVVAGFQSHQWTMVHARILSATLTPSFLAPAQPDIRYEYVVGGQSYVSNSLWPGRILAHMPLMRSKESQQLLLLYQTGAVVEAYVDPVDPGNVALIAGPKRAFQWLSVFVLVFLTGIWSPLAAEKLKSRKDNGSV